MGIFGLKLCRVIIYCNFHLFVSIRVVSVNYIQLDSEVLRTQGKKTRTYWQLSEISTILQMILKPNSKIAKSSMLLNKQKKGRRRGKATEGG